MKYTNGNTYKAMYDACSIFVVDGSSSIHGRDDAINSNRLSVTVMHVSLCDDPFAEHDQIFFHVLQPGSQQNLNQQKQQQQQDGGGIPLQIIVNSRSPTAAAKLAWLVEKPDRSNENMILHFITNPSAVAMMVYKQLVLSSSSSGDGNDQIGGARHLSDVKHISCIETTSRGKMISMYAMQLEDGSVDFVISRYICLVNPLFLYLSFHHMELALVDDEDGCKNVQEEEPGPAQAKEGGCHPPEGSESASEAARQQ